MIIVLKPKTQETDIQNFIEMLKQKGLGVHISAGVDHTILGLIGDTTKINEQSLKAYQIVDQVMRVQSPYKMANRAFHPQNTLIHVPRAGADDVIIGEPNFSVMAGPCSVESEQQIVEIAEAVKKSGAKFLRGGAFKPRTSPYSFQGMGCEGIDLLMLAKKATGLPIVTELMGINQLEVFGDVDIIQIGARNMQNFTLLKELGRCGKPILLKRGLANTAKELLMSAEYIMAGGNEQVILCERGIRSFDTFTRNVLDLGVIPFLKKETHLPVIVDPSHATGLAWMVEPMAKAALAAGADGIIVEVHNNPEAALCDGEQSITPTQFDELMHSLRQYAEIEHKIM
ncbi:MAG: 3-deoxy-7-phosphoheptulonate synthase [Bacteroides sp.]|nr:3-deoxy-7-phosphoheptulonate synthase [Prevotella sp.]MCM1406875.1 3-deoxy-7-phosphoheptulonate synthase [Treponema brennaborense]MCM1470026.1 3-deoxy-7-phosphoheptulonate synthase [Bacteroides sp.]